LLLSSFVFDFTFLEGVNMIINMNYDRFLDKIDCRSITNLPNYTEGPAKILIVPLSRGDKLVDNYFNDAEHVKEFHNKLYEFIKNEVTEYYKYHPEEVSKALSIPLGIVDYDIFNNLIKKEKYL